jgi:hypothetical protein
MFQCIRIIFREYDTAVMRLSGSVSYTSDNLPRMQNQTLLVQF